MNAVGAEMMSVSISLPSAGSTALRIAPIAMQQRRGECRLP
jgi:hypothetical protein